MFDLHMHTDQSDGKLSVQELLHEMEQRKFERFAITDHNHCIAYEKFDSDVYKNIIVGTEITTSYKGYIVEVLGYHVNPAIINEWFRAFYHEDNMRKNELFLFNKLKKLSKKNNYVLTDGLQMEEIVKGNSKKTIYNDLVKHNENFPFGTYKAFFRNALSVPTHTFFLNEAQTYPEFSEVIELIHQAGGIAILAHPHEYGVDDTTSLFEFVKNNGADGIEGFHPSASYRQGIEILKFCEKNDMVSSGGSDFHRFDREIPFGVHLSDTTRSHPALAWITK